MITPRKPLSKTPPSPESTSTPPGFTAEPELQQLIDAARKCAHQRFLRLPEVKRRVGRSRGSVYNDIAAGLMPPPVPLSTRAVGWLESEIDAVVDARVLMARASYSVDMKAFVAQLIAPRMVRA